MENINYLPLMVPIFKKSYDNLPSHEYLGNNVYKFANIYNPNNYKSGVYFIEDFYIGKSINLNNRIANHIFGILTIGFSDNYNLSLRILEILQYRKLEVQILDSDVKMEKFHIYENRDKYLLLNKQYNK